MINRRPKTGDLSDMKDKKKYMPVNFESLKPIKISNLERLIQIQFIMKFFSEARIKIKIDF